MLNFINEKLSLQHRKSEQFVEETFILKTNKNMCELINNVVPDELAFLKTLFSLNSLHKENKITPTNQRLSQFNVHSFLYLYCWPCSVITYIS